jgi:hypothetical protein
VDLPDGRRIRMQVDEAVEIPDEWLDPESPEYRVWPATLWEVTGGPEDTRTAAELRDALKTRGLPTSGRKPELLARLTAAEADEQHRPAAASPPREALAAVTDTTEQGE